MKSPRTLVVHPPVSVARDFIDYPYFSDLGAVQLAGVLRDHDLDVTLVDAFALSASGLTWRPDGRAHLGAGVADALAAADRAPDPGAIVVAYSAFHRPPHRCDVLGPLLHGLRARHPDATLVLADCYQSGQHYVESAGAEVLAAYPEIDAWIKYEAEHTAVELLGAPPRERTVVHASPRPASTPSPCPRGTWSTSPPTTAFAAASSMTSAAAPGRFPSTAARCR
jgi:hypothetical protein